MGKIRIKVLLGFEIWRVAQTLKVHHRNPKNFTMNSFQTSNIIILILITTMCQFPNFPFFVLRVTSTSKILNFLNNHCAMCTVSCDTLDLVMLYNQLATVQSVSRKNSRFCRVSGIYDCVHIKQWSHYRSCRCMQ